MPTYDYRSNATGEIFEVKHRMSESFIVASGFASVGPTGGIVSE